MIGATATATEIQNNFLKGNYNPKQERDSQLREKYEIND